MPSGSKKRKALKKPKPGEPFSSQGEPPELEPGFEESMAKDGEEMVEGSPSPKVMDEAMADFGVEEGKELVGEASREEDEIAEVEEALAPDHPEVSTRDLPSQIELGPEVPPISEAEARDENDIEGGRPTDIPEGDPPPLIEETKDIPLDERGRPTDIPQGDPPPQIEETKDIPLDERGRPTYIPQGDPPPQIEETKDIPLDESSPDSEAFPGEIKPLIEPDADLTGLERDKDGAGAPPIDIKPEPDGGEPAVAFQNEIGQEALVGSEPGHGEPPVELEQMAAVAQENAGPEDDNTPDDVSAVRVDPGADAMDSVMDAPSGENDEAMVARELHTEADSANVEPEGTDVAPVEIAAETDDGLASVQSEVDEAVVETQPETDAAAEVFHMDPEVADTQPETDEDPVVGELEGDTPSADIKPEATDDTSPDLAVEIEGPPDVQSEMNEAADRRQLETDAVPSILESETAESELEKDAVEVVEDASIGEIDQEVESVASGIESQTDKPEGEAGVEPVPEITLREAESETVTSPGEIKPEVDAVFDETKKDEVAEADTKSEVNATPTGGEQGEGPLVVTKPESDEKASIELEPEVEVENTHMSLEAEKEIEMEPERPPDASQEIEAVTGPATSEVEEVDGKVEPGSLDVSGSKDLIEGVETPIDADIVPKEVTIHEIELVDNTESANEALTEPSAVSGHKEEHNNGVDTPLEADTEPDRETTCAYQPEAEAVVPDAEMEVPSKLEPDLEDSNETELSQQHLIEVETDQQDHAQETQQQEREADADVGGELSASKANQEETLSFSAMAEAGLVDGSSPSASEGEAPAIAEEGAVDEKLDASNECIVQQESTNGDDVLDQEKAPSGEVIEVPSGESEITEQGSNTTLLPGSEVTVNEYEPMAGVIFEKGQNYDSPAVDVERDIGEEEATLSTVAEAGSVVNDFDESASDQQLPTDFPSSEHDAEISEWRELKDTISSRTPDLLVTGVTEQADGEGREFYDLSSPRAPELIKGGSAKLVGGEHADSCGDDNRVSVAAVGYSPKDEVEWKSVQDLGPTTNHEELSPESIKAENLATTSLESYIEVPVDVCLSEESNAPDKEVNFVEGGDGDENVQGMVSPTLGIVPALESLAVSEELMPKVLPSVTDGLQSLPSTEATTDDPFTPGGGTDNLDNAAVNTVEPEIYTSEAKDSDAVAYAPSGEVFMNASNGASPQSASPGQDIEDVQAFRQQKTQEASLPVVVPAKDVKQRALNLKVNEHPSRGGTLQRRTDWLGCCGMFDLLLGKNK